MNALLHPKTAAQIAALMEHPSGSVIFYGAGGLGKAGAARELAARLNCLGDQPAQCANCRQIAAGNFPDLLLVERLDDKPSISIEQVRGLTAELALRPFGAAARVVIIDPADRLTPEAQNALLKLLEEPPPHTLIILVAQHLQELLITVRSRCQVVYFVRPDAAEAPLDSLSSDVAGLQSQSVFERLLLAARLASTGADLERFGEILHRRVIARLQSSELDPHGANIWLSALERFRLHLRAKVSARVALERLMLELS